MFGHDVTAVVRFGMAAMARLAWPVMTNLG